MPLNWDPVTDLVIALLGTPLLDGFIGELDPAGAADAMLTLPALPPGYVGTKLHFAWCLYSPFDFVSNPVEVEIVN
jgi:hypothetical protein